MEGSNKQHDECKNERRIDRLEEKSDRLDTKIDRIMDIISENKSQLTKIITRLDKKREDDKQRNKQLEKEDGRLIEVEKHISTLSGQNKILITIMTTMLVAFILFFIEFQYKTYFLHL